MSIRKEVVPMSTRKPTKEKVGTRELTNEDEASISTPIKALYKETEAFAASLYQQRRNRLNSSTRRRQRLGKTTKIQSAV
jgi:hypothetical protein